MGMQSVYQAFTQSFMDLGLGVFIDHENNTVDPPNNAPHVSLTLIPNVAESLGKDINSADEVRGVYQISFYTPSGTSTGVILPLIDTTLAFFRHNREMTYSDQIVTVINSGRGGGRNGGGWYVIDCTIDFKSDLVRVA
jgi:hypothetical protein